MKLSRLFAPVFLLVATLLALHGETMTDVLIADFEGLDYGKWSESGTAFHRGPARESELGQLEIENAQGRGVASSEMDGDEPKGTLTSPEFKIERPYISFLIA